MSALPKVLQGIDEIMITLLGQPLDEVEYRLHCCDFQTYLQRTGNKDYGPPDGSNATRVNLTTTRQGKVITYTIG